jgi:hypothetical protein
MCLKYPQSSVKKKLKPLSRGREQKFALVAFKARNSQLVSATKARNSLLVKRAKRVTQSKPIFQERVKTDSHREYLHDPHQTQTVKKTGYETSIGTKTSPITSHLRLLLTIECSSVAMSAVK